jgi:hypothetical protein
VATYLRPTIYGTRDAEIKADRAKVHLDRIKAMMDALVESNPYTVTPHDDIKKNTHIVRIEINPISEEFGLLIGEFAYCLRSSLDNLTWQLALLHTVNPRRQTEFPILSSEPDPLKGFGDRTRDVIPAAMPVFESLQPYKKAPAFKDHPLWILNRLCNVDKHMAIAISHVNLPFRINGGVQIDVREVGEATEVAMSLADKSKAQFDPDPIQIVFGKPIDGAGDFFEVRVAGLTRIYEFVRNDVIPTFAGFFK